MCLISALTGEGALLVRIGFLWLAGQARPQTTQSTVFNFK
jgi:hypothetical protein